MKKQIIVFAAALLALTLAWQWFGGKQEKIVSTWIWHDAEAADVPFAREKGVTEMYVYVTEPIDAKKTAALIKKANSAGIDVYALQGEPDWDASDALRFIEAVKAYNAQSAFLFAGIVFDIEPYLLPEWQQNEPKQAAQFLALIQSAEKAAASLPVKWTIPFWLDGVKMAGGGFLGEAVFQEAGHVIVMSYRSKLKGRDGLLAHIEEEIKWAKQYDTKLIAAVETRKEPIAKTSFYGRDISELTAALEALKQMRGIDGVSVHHLHTWKDMQEKTAS